MMFLFWNLNRKPLADLVTALAIEHEVDVVILAECAIKPGELLIRLNTAVGPVFHYPPSVCDRIRIFTRFSARFLTIVHESNRFTIRRLTLPARPDILLVAAHLPSKLRADPDDQRVGAELLARTIADEETRAGHQRTLLIGDLNMNPFEPGVAGANGLNGAMTRPIAARGSRIVQGRSYPFFYNPMWGCFGDNTPGPPGTYYYPGSSYVTYFWNVFDQVLLRPELLDRFPGDSLKIATRAGNTPLVREDGVVNSRTSSDHLPLVFQLNL